MKDIQKIKEFFSKPLEEVKKDKFGNHLEPQFKKGDKVTYLGNPGEITGVNKEMTGAYTYNVSYDKGNGKTKATNITNKNGTDIKLAEIKSVKEVISTPMDAIEFLNSNKDEIAKLANQYKGDVVSMQKAIDAFLAPHIEGASDFIVNRLKSAIGSAIAKRNIAADPKLSAAYDTLKNIKGVVKEEYTVAGRPVTLNKGKKSNGTDWTVTFLTNSTIGKKGEEVPLVDVLALIKPFPKGITMKEAKEETAVDMAKKQLDALGVKYEMSKTDKVRPFKVIYRPVNKSDEFYDKFEDIVDLFNLKGFVKTSMEEAKFMSGLFSGKDFINAKLRNYPKAVAKVNQLIDMIGESRFTVEMAEWIWDFFNNASFESPVNEAKKEDAVDTITMDIPLFLRMLEYSREDAKKDLDLHDVTEKANKLGKEKGILSMEDYDAIVGAAEEIDEAELSEAYVPSNIKEFAKRKGVSSLVNKVAGWAEKVGKGIRGGTAIGYNYSTLILDMTYQGSEIRINTDNDTVTLYDEPVNSFPEFKQVYLDNQDESDNSLEERIAEALDKINEELCPAGKAYIKRRKAAGEKSSAYLSGRAVKVCKGQMSGRAKKK